MLLSLTINSSIASDSEEFTASNTPLNDCETKASHNFKREKRIFEKCPAKDDFHIFIQGETEETLKFSLEKEINKPLIRDDPFTKIIKIRGKNGSDSSLSGEITGSHVSWIFNSENELAGVVLKRLQGKTKTYEAFRFLDKHYFCHIGGNLDHAKTIELIKLRKACL